MNRQMTIVPYQGRMIELEYQWIHAERKDSPLIVFLHEGLGSVAMWRDFPERLCDEIGCRGLVYSRYGYGGSTGRSPSEHWGPDYLHRQAHELLPAFLRSVGVAEKPWLFGHSDGASIALLYAAEFPEDVAGAIVLAPHINVEQGTLRGIERTCAAYESGGLKQKLSRHHADPDSAFWGWHDAWMNPDFLQWSIEAALPQIRCPLLLVQGYGDEYASMSQVEGIKRLVPHSRLLQLESCGHSPHRDQPQQVIQATARLMGGLADL